MDDKNKRHYCMMFDAMGATMKQELLNIGGKMPEQGSTGGGHHMASREFSLAATKIDEAVMWAKVGIDKA